ncbi:MAG: 2-hydroxycyclohexanecarboxyl-CoA dehydrogenase [Acidimicrobiia bacterium]|mgnify:FL=1
MTPAPKRASAIVTGAARGIGFAIAQQLVRNSIAVAIFDRDGNGARMAAKQLGSTDVPTLSVEIDLTDTHSIPAAVDHVREAWGSIEVLVNNAGWDEIRPFLQTTPEFWDRVLKINLVAVMGMCKAVAPLMIEHGYGRIVNIASDAARVGSTGEVPYSGAKAGVVGFSKALARELARHGITVNVVCPGPCETPLLDEMTAKSDQASNVLRAISKSIPMGRLARPEDVAYAVGFFASEEAGYITGQVLSVSGGLTMAG